VLTAVVCVAFVAPNADASGMDVWKECVKTGAVTTNHAQADFKDALTNPPADASEYSSCLDAIRAAQNAKGLGAAAGAGAAAGGGTSSGGTGGGSQAAASPSAASVEPAELSAAIRKAGIDPAAAVGVEPPAPAPVTVAGESIDLEGGQMPSLANAFSLPLPVAASAVIVMIAAAMPVVRFVAARFRGTATTPPASPPAP
jgi:hypothetical protein